MKLIELCLLLSLTVLVINRNQVNAINNDDEINDYSDGDADDQGDGNLDNQGTSSGKADSNNKDEPITSMNINKDPHIQMLDSNNRKVTQKNVDTELSDDGSSKDDVIEDESGSAGDDLDTDDADDVDLDGPNDNLNNDDDDDTSMTPSAPGTSVDNGGIGGGGGKRVNTGTQVSLSSKFFSIISKPGILAGIIGGIVIALLTAILLIMFIVYRMRKKDEGSYALEDTKKPLSSYEYRNVPTKEFYA